MERYISRPSQYPSTDARNRSRVRLPILRWSSKPRSSEKIVDSFVGRSQPAASVDSRVLPISREPPFFLYRMSYLWYTWLGCLTAILVGLLVSWITGPNKRTPGDEKLYTPVIRGLLRDSVAIAAKRQQVRPGRASRSRYRSFSPFSPYFQEGVVTELEKMDGSCRATTA